MFQKELAAHAALFGNYFDTYAQQNRYLLYSGGEDPGEGCEGIDVVLVEAEFRGHVAAAF